MRILYLDLDTLRPDHLGCYGYHRNTSPNIDRIAAQGVRFDNTHCSDAPCLPSRTALMSGMFGIHTGVVGHGGTCADIRIEGSPRGFKDRLWRQSLPGFLRTAGLKTVSISPFAERHSSWSFYAGFSEMHNTGKSGSESAEEITPTVLKWIEANAKADNWFLQVNYWDPHTQYRAPVSFGNPFKDEPIPDWITPEVLARHRKKVGPFSAQELAMYTNVVKDNPRYPGELKDMADLHKLFDGYDCGIAFMDSHIGRLFDAFEAAGVMDELIVIISSDHAENMGELGIYAEHSTANSIVTRIPMIVRWPGCKAGHVDTGLHYNLDLAPTLADMLGKEPVGRWDGQSYAPAIRAGQDCGRDYLVLSQCCHVCQRGVRFGPWMYVRTYHDGYHLFPDDMLFNVQDDPHEQVNLAEKHPEVCREAVYLLTQWHDAMMKTMPFEPRDADPLWTVIREGGPLHARGQLKAYCERLQQTGRGDAIPELKRRHPGEFA
ncbi:MAG: sulfatase [Kiritimatiellae bacterium]|nr:sulfatase [Kiritimatiellia bacterium]